MDWEEYFKDEFLRETEEIHLGPYSISWIPIGDTLVGELRDGWGQELVYDRLTLTVQRIKMEPNCVLYYFDYEWCSHENNESDQTGKGWTSIPALVAHAIHFNLSD